MLDFIWSGIFLISSLIALFFHHQLLDKKEYEKSGNWYFSSAMLLFFALVISWEKIGSPYWGSVRNVMPQKGVTISEVTAIVIVGLTAAVFIAITQYLGYGFYYLFGRINKGHFFNFNKRLTAINTVLNGYNHGQGIYKRIDENRELLELLQKKCPEFMQEHFWVEGWLKANDDFFTDLAVEAIIKNRCSTVRDFPRPWPGSNLSQTAEL